jgi:hypothetical protein
MEFPNLIGDQQLGNFIKHIQESLLPKKGQRVYGDIDNIFLEDWCAIELLKYFYIGRERYLTEPIPRRLEGNSSFSVEKVANYAERKRDHYRYCLEEKHNELVIFKVGRGVDLFLATKIKYWDSIWCCDDDYRYGELLKRFFSTIDFSFGNEEFVLNSKKGEFFVIKSTGLYEW